MTVTAIVSAYYAKEFIRSRLENLLAQEPLPEIIVVAQTDSVEWAISSTYPVRLIMTPHVPTIYAAWNMAIKEATGDYITNANCDDQTFAGSYNIMAGILDNNPDIALVYGNEYVQDENNSNEVNLKLRPDCDFNLLQSKCVIGPFPMWRKSLHDKYGYFDENLTVCGDYEFWLRIAQGGEKLFHIRQFLGQYTRRASSAEHRNMHQANSENLQVRQKYS